MTQCQNSVSESEEDIISENKEYTYFVHTYIVIHYAAKTNTINLSQGLQTNLSLPQFKCKNILDTIIF